jgi:hypothetical protein
MEAIAPASGASLKDAAPRVAPPSPIGVGVFSIPDAPKAPSLAAPQSVRATVPHNIANAITRRGLITESPLRAPPQGTSRAPPQGTSHSWHAIRSIVGHDCFVPDKKAADNRFFRNVLPKCNAGVAASDIFLAFEPIFEAI